MVGHHLSGSSPETQCSSFPTRTCMEKPGDGDSCPRASSPSGTRKEKEAPCECRKHRRAQDRQPESIAGSLAVVTMADLMHRVFLKEKNWVTAKTLGPHCQSVWLAKIHKEPGTFPALVNQLAAVLKPCKIDTEMPGSGTGLILGRFSAGFLVRPLAGALFGARRILWQTPV